MSDNEDLNALFGAERSIINGPHIPYRGLILSEAQVKSFIGKGIEAESSLKTVTSDLETTRSALAAAKAEIEGYRGALGEIKQWAKCFCLLEDEVCEPGGRTCPTCLAEEALSQGEAERLSATIEADILKGIGAEKLLSVEAHDRDVRNRALEEAANFHRRNHLKTCRCKRCREAASILRALRSPEEQREAFWREASDRAAGTTETEVKEAFKGQGEIPK